jgi:polyhydroxyalkanoate synthesis regulator phasin
MAFRDLLTYIDLQGLSDDHLDKLKEVLDQELERARKALDLLNDAVPALEEKLRDLERESRRRQP